MQEVSDGSGRCSSPYGIPCNNCRGQAYACLHKKNQRAVLCGNIHRNEHFFNNLFHNHFLLRISTIIFFRHAPAKDACRGCLLEVYIQRILSIHPARCIYTSNAPHLYIRQGRCPFFKFVSIFAKFGCFRIKDQMCIFHKSLPFICIYKT